MLKADLLAAKNIKEIFRKRFFCLENFFFIESVFLTTHLLTDHESAKASAPKLTVNVRIELLNQITVYIRL